MREEKTTIKTKQLIRERKRERQREVGKKNRAKVIERKRDFSEGDGETAIFYLKLLLVRESMEGWWGPFILYYWLPILPLGLLLMTKKSRCTFDFGFLVALYYTPGEEDCQTCCKTSEIVHQVDIYLLNINWNILVIMVKNKFLCKIEIV